MREVLQLTNKLVVRQAIKFVIVGTSGLIIDLGVLNVLMWATGVFSGPFYSLFKTISFVAAVINNYVWNKLWTFQKKDTKEIKKEFAKFFAVAAIGLVINVSVASVVVNFWEPQFGLSPRLWATLAGALAALAAATWDFLGYKFLVFKK